LEEADRTSKAEEAVVRRQAEVVGAEALCRDRAVEAASTVLMVAGAVSRGTKVGMVGVLKEQLFEHTRRLRFLLVPIALPRLFVPQAHYLSTRL